MKKKKVFSVPWFFIESLEYPKYGITSENPYYRVVDINGVVVLAVTKDERIILVRQFRPALGHYSLELPAGGIRNGESLVEAARRELYEETGYRAKEFIKLNQGMYLFSSRSNMKNFPFLAKGIVKDKFFQPKENIEIQEITLSKIRTMVSKNKFSQLPALGVILLWLWNDKCGPRYHIR